MYLKATNTAFPSIKRCGAYPSAANLIPCNYRIPRNGSFVTVIN